MLNRKELHPYDEAVLSGIISDGRVSVEDALAVFNEYYPVVRNIYQREVEPEKYSKMLLGIKVKGLTHSDVIQIVKPRAHISVLTQKNIKRRAKLQPRAQRRLHHT